MFPAKFKVFPILLEEVGYHMGYTGKGWGPGDFLGGGFSHNPAGHPYNDVLLTPPVDTGISTCDYTANFENFLNKKTDEAPFCFWYGGIEPHRAYVKGEVFELETSS